MHINKILSALRKYYKNKLIEWTKGLNPFEILIGTVLSQRTRDVNTEIAVKNLFSKYNSPQEIANANIKELESLIKSCGFYKVKARYIKKISKILINKFDGKVPKERSKLLSLPGVGPKTSAIVLVYGFGIPEAIPVDVHVHRISNRLGIVKTKKPEETEKQLMKTIPKKYWIDLNRLFVLHGQNICLPRNPKCDVCPINKWCKFYRSKK
ncbi:MAG: endonuclease III [Nanoarchaeota archaeon]|nr:endonuclease III [Nanoarchaeota archaeon]